MKCVCPQCGKQRATTAGCVCNGCAQILLDDAKREMYGDDADWLNDDTGDQ